MKHNKLSERQQKNMRAVLAKEGSSGALIDGDVVCHRGKDYDVRSDNQEIYKVLSSRRFAPVVGDRVILKMAADRTMTLVQIAPRRNELSRFDHHTRKSVAANIDYACVVVASKPIPWPEMVAQYITYLNILNISPCFIINKTDLGLPPESVCSRLKYLQEAIKLPVFYGSAYNGDLVAQLKLFLAGHRAIFIGPSGVGKSSLIQKFFPEELLKVGDLSQGNKGCHTTSVTQLYELRDGMAVIDAPGIRQCALGEITREELKKGFVDFQNQGCRFKDCDHIRSAGCAILGGIAQDKQVKQRYEDYLFLGQKFIDIGF
jgi:ribosome biogenesis GTPase